MDGNRLIDLSVIIVNYNVKHFAEQCIRSLYAASGNLEIEIFLVDNASLDGSVDYLKSRFENVHYIVNTDNIGFGRANNTALKRANGRYLLILNPDTLVEEDTLHKMIEYLDQHPEIGAAGPKIIDRNGKFDRSSKRGLPTPWVAFCRLSGLSRLFPKSKLFGRYDLLYLDSDKPAEVDALAGSCMFVRREAYTATNGFDEDFFMYGEDIDWSYRIKLAGWKVFYVPITRIIHFRGESTRRSDIDRDRLFYGAMQLFVDKHFRGRYPRLVHWWLSLGIFLAEWIARIGHLTKKIALPTTDLAGLWGVLVLGRYARWGAISLNTGVTLSLLFQALTTVVCLAVFGAYGRRRGELRPLALGLGLGFFINSSFTFFFKQFAYSRFVTLFGLIVGGVYIWGWRIFLRMFLNSRIWQRYFRRTAAVVGAGSSAREVARRLREDQSAPYNIIGFVDPTGESVGSIIDNLPVLGDSSDIDRLVEQEPIEELLFAPDQIDYNKIVDIVSRLDYRRKINFKVITPEALKDKNTPIPQLSVEYLAPRPVTGSIRKISSVLFRQ